MSIVLGTGINMKKTSDKELKWHAVLPIKGEGIRLFRTHNAHSRISSSRLVGPSSSLIMSEFFSISELHFYYGVPVP
jgi:hypothetical protein